LEAVAITSLLDLEARMRGRKPVPTQVKLLRGNPGKRPLNEGEPQSEQEANKMKHLDEA
jgi:hypothetical protein